MTFRDTDGNELIFNGDFAMTKQSVSIFSGTIKGDVSITFQLDNNSVNRKILNYSGPQMANQVAFTRQTFSRINKGNFIDQGYIVIQSEDSDFLNCFYVSGNSNWLQLFSRLITELDYSGVTNGKNYTRQFNETSIKSSQAEGITFPFIDWCFNLNKGDNYYEEDTPVWTTPDDDSNVAIIQFYPCFFMHSLVSEIMNQSDVKKDGTLFTEGLYTSLAVTPVDGQIKRAPFKKVLLNGSSQTYSAGVGVFEKVTGLTLRQGDVTSWDDVNKRFTCPIQSMRYIGITMRSGTATSVQIRKNGSRLSSSIPITLGIKQTSELTALITGAVSVGDYYELYVTKSTGSPFSAAFDVEFYIPEEILPGDYIDPANFLPPMQSIDLLKFLFNYFGCSVYFDSTSKTLTANIIERMKLEDAYDWSEFYISHSSYFIDNVANHNYINWTEVEDNTIDKYNRLHSLKFADGDLQTDNTLLSERQVSQLPFAPSPSGLSFNGAYLLNIPLINLVDDGDPIVFTGIGLSAAGPPNRSFFTTGVASVLNVNEVVRVTNGNGDDIGYYRVFSTGAPNGETLVFPFASTDSGKIWRQKLEYLTTEPRVVSVKPSTNSTEFSQSGLNGAFTAFSTSPYATFTKSLTNLPIDQWRNNLALDNPDSGNYTDPTIKELYFNKISRFLNNPRIRAVMLLPDSVYQRFKFDQFIYLKTEKLTGYFFVDTIINYVDGKTPVEITLYML